MITLVFWPEIVENDNSGRVEWLKWTGYMIIPSFFPISSQFLKKI